MYVIIWRFTTNEPVEFERHYSTGGTWAALFRRSSDYVRTDLLRAGDHYLTLDWWTSREAYDTFRDAYADEYARIDAACETVTASEELIGAYEHAAIQ